MAPAPSPTTTRPPQSLTQGHIDFVEVLIASCFRQRRRGRHGSHQPGAKPVHDWGCGVGAVSREGQSRRPAASHSRTQTSCSTERARAPAASSPSHPQQRAGRGTTETNCGPERPTRNWCLAALAGAGRRTGVSALSAGSSRCPSASTVHTIGNISETASETLAWHCCSTRPAAERPGTPLCSAASGGWTDPCEHRLQ